MLAQDRHAIRKHERIDDCRKVREAYEQARVRTVGDGQDGDDIGDVDEKGRRHGVQAQHQADYYR